MPILMYRARLVRQAGIKRTHVIDSIATTKLRDYADWLFRMYDGTDHRHVHVEYAKDAAIRMRGEETKPPSGLDQLVEREGLLIEVIESNGDNRYIGVNRDSEQLLNETLVEVLESMTYDDDVLFTDHIDLYDSVDDWNAVTRDDRV